MRFSIVALAMLGLIPSSQSFSSSHLSGGLGAGRQFPAGIHAQSSSSRRMRGPATHNFLSMSGKSASSNKIPVIFCPAQFGTPEDYVELEGLLADRGFQLYAAPLSRFDWLKIVPATLTPDFFLGKLKPSKTLKFFYERIDEAIVKVNEEHGEDCKVVFLGHSIGGWVARSYIGEVLDKESVSRVRSLVTLGTPNNAPPSDSPVAALDQTRGLLTYINDNFAGGHPLPASKVACVAGSGTSVPDSIGEIVSGAGSRVWDDEVGRSLLLEQIVALTSYLPLSGSALGVKGDGLIPVQTALMGGETTSLVLDDCNHAAFVPTPGKSIQLPSTYLWYGSPSLIDSWIKLL